MAALTSEATFADLELIKEAEIILDLSDIGQDHECKFSLDVFAYTTDTDDTYRNDFFAPILTLSNRFENPKFFLEKKNTKTCLFEEKAALTDDTYGTYSTFTSQPDWLGYILQWHLVYTAFGRGCYRIRAEFDDKVDTGSNPKITFSYSFNLRLFTDELADKSIKITYTQNGGKTGDKFDDKRVIDFKDIVWQREFRVKGYFGYETSEYEREETRFENGARVWTKDEQIELFLCEIQKIPYELHRSIKIDALQADELFISDYNQGNQHIYDHKQVIRDSNYEPVWAEYNSYAPVQLRFKPYFQNYDRERC